MPEKTTQQDAGPPAAYTGPESGTADLIKVTSRELVRRQEEWLALAGWARESFQEAVTDTRELNGFFDAGPVRRLQRQFLELGKEGEAALKELKAHLSKLSEIAALYERAERSNRDVSTADH